MKLKLSERERWLLFGTLLALVFYLFYVFLLNPKLSAVDSLNQKLRSLNLDLKVSKEKVKILQSLELLPMEKIRAKKTKEEQTIEALKYLTAEISKLQLKLLTLRPRGEERAVGSAKAIYFDLTFSGKYNTIYKFMQALDKLPILILVDSLTMSKGEGPGLNVAMVVSVYY
jgi:Tfp pilus assembly protein PilO